MENKAEHLKDRLQIIFVSTTQYTFLITDIYARYIFKRYGIKSIVFHRIVKGFDEKKYDTDEMYSIIPYSVKNQNILGQCCFALECGYLYNFTSWSKVIDKSRKTLLFAFNDKNKLVARLMTEVRNSNKDNRVVLIEEGTDTYSDSLELAHLNLYHLKHAISKALFGIGRSSDVIGSNPCIDSAIVKNPERYKRLKKSKNQEVIQQNPDILSFSSEFIDHYSKAESNEAKYDLIYIGQPYYKNGKYFEYENDCIRSFIDSLPETTKVLIKPHPREDSKKYQNLADRYSNVSIISEDLAPLPIETLLFITKTEAVVTIQSSAALTVANLFPNINSYVLRKTPEAKVLEKKLKEAGQELPQIDDSYFIGKYNNVFLPETIQECRDHIQRAKKQINEKVYSQNKQTYRFPEIDDLMCFE